MQLHGFTPFPIQSSTCTLILYVFGSWFDGGLVSQFTRKPVLVPGVTWASMNGGNMHSNV